MAYLEIGPRVGRSQGASIFWGLISTCFAAAACYYFLENQKNTTTANVMRDQVLELKEENESLTSQKEHLQAAQVESESQLKTREDLMQEKEAQLAAEESRIENLGAQTQDQSQQNLAQVAVVKKLNDVIHALGKDTPPDVVERGGRPVLRLPNATLFAPGDSVLTSEGKATLGQIAQGLGNQLNGFELRVVSYTDTAAEADAKTDPSGKPAPAADPAAKSGSEMSWTLTEARASALAHFLRDQTQLPFVSVLVQGRGDAEPIASNAGENHARNRRVEISVAPLPVSFHAPDLDKTTAHADSHPAGSTPPASKKTASKSPSPASDKTKTKTTPPVDQPSTTAKRPSR